MWEELWSLRESKTAGARHSLPERNPSIKAWLSMRPPLEVFTLPQIFSEFLNQNMWRKYVERDTNKHMQWMKTNITWLQVTRQCSIHHTHTHLFEINKYTILVYIMAVIFTLLFSAFTEAVYASALMTGKNNTKALLRTFKTHMGESQVVQPNLHNWPQ